MFRSQAFKKISILRMLGGIILFLWTTEATTTPLTMTKFNGIWEVFGGIEVDGYGQAILETLVIKNGRVKSNIYCTDAMINHPGKISKDGVYEGYGSGTIVNAKLHGYFTRTRGYGRIILWGDEVHKTGYWIAFKRKRAVTNNITIEDLYNPPPNSHQLRKITHDKMRSYYYTWEGQQKLSKQFERVESQFSTRNRRETKEKKSRNQQIIMRKMKFDEVLLKLKRIDRLTALKHIEKNDASKQKKIIIDQFLKND